MHRKGKGKIYRRTTENFQTVLDEPLFVRTYERNLNKFVTLTRHIAHNIEMVCTRIILSFVFFLSHIP